MRAAGVRLLFIAALLLSASLLGAGTHQQVRGRTSGHAPSRQTDAPRGAIKWEETFDTQTIPPDWQVIDNDSSGSAWTFRQLVTLVNGVDTYYVAPEVGQSFWFSSFNGANSNNLIDEYIITPRLPLIEPRDTLRFYAGAIGGQYHDSLRVKVSITDSLLGSFDSLIAYFKVDGPTGSWHRYSFDLSRFAGERPFIAVNYFIVSGGRTGNHSDNVWVDHFILESGPPLVVKGREEIPATFSVGRNYPNPFNPSTTITYDVAKPAMVRLIVYNLLGQEVRTLVSRQMEPGRYAAVWDGRNNEGRAVVSGAYLYRFYAGGVSASGGEAGGVVQTRKMMLVK